MAQPVLVPLSPPPTEQSSATFLQTNGLAGASALAAVEPDADSRDQLRWGPFVAHPRIDYQYANISGLRQGAAGFQGTNPIPRTVSSIQHTISPGISIQLGKQWRLDAGAGLNYYTEPALQDNTSYSVGLNGSIPRDEWIFGISAGFSRSESTLIETASQTKQDSYSTSLSAVYGTRRRTSLELGVSQNIALSEGLNDTISWTTMNWLNYVMTPRTTAGFGLGGGYNFVDAGGESFSASGTDSVFEQVQGRVLWKPLDKLSINLSGGAQIQQFLADDGSKNVVNPIFSISAGYSPVDGTSFSLSGSRSVGNSITSDQYTETMTFAFGMSQRLLKRLTLTIGPSYGTTEYRSSSDAAATLADRSEDFWSIQIRLSTVLLRRVSMSTYFQYSDNSSTDEFYTFDTRQFGFQIGYYF